MAPIAFQMCVARRAPTSTAVRVVRWLVAVWPSAATAPAATICSIAPQAVLELGRERDHAHSLGREPACQLAEVDRAEMIRILRADRLRAQVRTLEMSAEARGIVRQLLEETLDRSSGRGPDRREVAGHALLGAASVVVDVEIDEPREDQRAVDVALLDRGDPIAVDPEQPRPHSVDRIDEESLDLVRHARILSQTRSR